MAVVEEAPQLSQRTRSILLALANLLSTTYGFILLATVFAVLILVAKGCRVG